MKGDNPLLVAQEDGHSVETMLRTYAAWIKGAKPEDVEGIKQAMTARPSIDAVGDESGVCGPLQSPDLATIWPPTEQIDGLRGATGDTMNGPAQAPSVCFNRSKGGKTDTEELAGVPGLFGPDGPHPFGAALLALTRWDNLDRVATVRDERLESYNRALRALSSHGRSSSPEPFQNDERI